MGTSSRSLCQTIQVEGISPVSSSSRRRARSLSLPVVEHNSDSFRSNTLGKINLCLLAIISLLTVSFLTVSFLLIMCSSDLRIAAVHSRKQHTFEPMALDSLKGISSERIETHNETTKLKLVSERIETHIETAQPSLVSEPIDTRNGTTKPKLVLISALFGATSIKPLLPFFLKSVANSDFDVLLFGDTNLHVTLPPNVRHLLISWTELQQRIMLNVPECFPYGLHSQRHRKSTPLFRKIIDYKPLFGMILQDEISEYDIWGHIDNDLVMGDVMSFFPMDVLASAEVIPYKKGERTQKASIVSGPFSLFRNTRRVNSLFRRAPLVCEMLRSMHPWGFDEWFGPNNTNMESVILDAWRDPHFELRLAPPHSGAARMYDGDDPSHRHQMLCEMQCPPSLPASALAAAPSPALDALSFPSQDQVSGAKQRMAVGRAEQCALFERKCPTCSKTPVLFCHFQHWKLQINSFLSNQTTAENRRLLNAETLQFSWSDLVTAVHNDSSLNAETLQLSRSDLVTAAHNDSASPAQATLISPPSSPPERSTRLTKTFDQVVGIAEDASPATVVTRR